MTPERLEEIKRKFDDCIHPEEIDAGDVAELIAEVERLQLSVAAYKNEVAACHAIIAEDNDQFVKDRLDFEP